MESPERAPERLLSLWCLAPEALCLPGQFRRVRVCVLFGRRELRLSMLRMGINGLCRLGEGVLEFSAFAENQIQSWGKECPLVCWLGLFGGVRGQAGRQA